MSSWVAFAPGTPETSYAEPLANNFEVMTQLYPRFIDPYYFAQAFLAPISPEAAGKANTILETGIAAYPNDLVSSFLSWLQFFLVDE